MGGIHPGEFRFDVYTEDGRIKVLHHPVLGSQQDYISTPEIEVCADEIKIGCTVITLKAFEIISQHWYEYFATLPPQVVQEKES